MSMQLQKFKEKNIFTDFSLLLFKPNQMIFLENIDIPGVRRVSKCRYSMHSINKKSKQAMLPKKSNVC